MFSNASRLSQQIIFDGGAIELGLLPLETPAASTERVRYVNTASSAGGDGTTNNTSGATRAYVSLADALTAEATDLKNANVYLTIYCEGSAADTSEPVVTGFTTDATHYVQIIVTQANRHDGKWNTGKYRIVNSGYFGVIKVNAGHVRLYGLQLEQAKTSAGGGTSACGVDLLGDGGNSNQFIVDSCVLRYTGDYTNQTAAGINTNSLFDYTSHSVKISNNVIYDFKDGLYLRVSDSSTYAAYNNTIHNSQANGINYSYGASGRTIRLYNNICQSSTTKDYEDNASSGGTLNSATNISEDATSPDASFRSKVVVFVNEGSDDFHLSGSDTVAKDLGTDLSGDSFYIITDDVDGETRSGSWDIGADEYVSTGITGTAANTLAVLTQSVTAVAKNTGTAANALTVFTQSVTATAKNTGVVSNTLSVLTQSATATAKNTGTISNTLAVLTQSVAATAKNTGTISNTLAVFSQSVTGTVPANVTGVIANTLAALTQSVTATAKNTGTISNTLAVLTQSVTATAKNTGTISNTLAVLTQSVTATVPIDITGSAANTLSVLTQSVTATAKNTGTAANTLTAFTQSVTATVKNIGTISNTLAVLTQSVTATAKNTGTISNTLAVLTQSVTATVPIDITGTVSNTLAAVTQSVTVRVKNTGTAANTLAALAQAVSGQVTSNDRTGVIAQTLAAVVSSASGVLKVTGQISQTLAAAYSSGTAEAENTGDCEQVFGPVSCSVTVIVANKATAAIVLSAFSQELTGEVEIPNREGVISQVLSPLSVYICALLPFTKEMQLAPERDFDQSAGERSEVQQLTAATRQGLPLRGNRGIRESTGSNKTQSV